MNSKIVTCIICKEIINGFQSNKKLIENLKNFLNKKDIKKLEKIEKLSNYAICKWDLWQIIADIIEDENKSLANYFRKKVTKIYDFGENIISV